MTAVSPDTPKAAPVNYSCRGSDHEWDNPRVPCPTCHPDVPEDPNL